LIENTSIERDPSTSGPVVDTNLMTSFANIYAAGNILRGAGMHDLCALEGNQAAKNIIKQLKSLEPEVSSYVSVRAEFPIRYVVPQKIILHEVEFHRFSWFHPGFSIQMDHTLKNAVLEAWSGNKRIWNSSFSKLIANTRIFLPVHQFAWDLVDREKGVTLTAKASDS